MIDALKFAHRNKIFSLIVFLLCMVSFMASAQDTAFRRGKAAILLKEVVVSSEKPRKITLGTKNFTPLFWVSIMARDEKIYEHGKLVHIKKPSRLLTVNAHVGGNKKSRDSVTYQLNLYKIRNGLPAELLIKNSLVKTFPSTANLLTFELSSENIYLLQDCVVAFEYLPKHHKKKNMISLRANMMGGDAFVREINADTWSAFKNGSAAIFVEVEQ
jgi:hypothetical protein